MSEMKFHGVVRWRRNGRTVPATVADRPLDLVQRDFTAARPNRLWGQRLHLRRAVAWILFAWGFVNDTLPRRNVGWRVSSPLRTDRFLDGMVHHSDRGGQYFSIRYAERFAEVGLQPSAGLIVNGGSSRRKCWQRGP